MIQKHLNVIGFVLMVVVLGCTTRHKPASPGDMRTFSKEAWETEVLESSELVLVDFWADWCGPCRMMDPTIETLAKDYKVVRVNVDKNSALSKRYDIDSIPALLIFKKGKIVEQFVGVRDEETLRAALEKASKGS
jgi:thioredoxin 1